MVELRRACDCGTCSIQRLEIYHCSQAMSLCVRKSAMTWSNSRSSPGRRESHEGLKRKFTCHANAKEFKCSFYKYETLLRRLKSHLIQLFYLPLIFRCKTPPFIQFLPKCLRKTKIRRQNNLSTKLICDRIKTFWVSSALNTSSFPQFDFRGLLSVKQTPNRKALDNKKQESG